MKNSNFKEKNKQKASRQQKLKEGIFNVSNKYSSTVKKYSKYY